jgi:hypothetical protein
MAHRRNVNNTEAHVNGPKKEHDGNHAKETSEDHGKDHGEQAREEAHQSRSATPGMQALSPRGRCMREGGRARRAAQHRSAIR